MYYYISHYLFFFSCNKWRCVQSIADVCFFIVFFLFKSALKLSVVIASVTKKNCR